MGVTTGAMLLVLIGAGSQVMRYMQQEGTLQFESPLAISTATPGRASNSRQSRQSTLVNSYDLSDTIRTSFLSFHNDFRRSVSPTASDMRELTWDSDLEQLAKQYSSECIFAHSEGLGTTEFSTVGENIHRGQSNPLLAPEASTMAWNNETQYYTFADNSCQEDAVCGHYLTLVWAATHKVGCGIALCNNLLQGNLDGFLTICHYGPEGRTSKIVNGVRVFDPPYQAGEACSACNSSLVCREGLCAVGNGTTETTTTVATTTTTTASTTTPTTTTTTTATTTTTKPTTTPTTTTTTTTTTSTTTTASTTTTTTTTTPPSTSTSATSTTTASGTTANASTFNATVDASGTTLNMTSSTCIPRGGGLVMSGMIASLAAMIFNY